VITKVVWTGHRENGNRGGGNGGVFKPIAIGAKREIERQLDVEEELVGDGPTFVAEGRLQRFRKIDPT